MLSSNSSEKKGVKKFIKNAIYRFFLHNEYDDEYQGYEEQGISFEEWKIVQTIENNYKKIPPDRTKEHPNELISPKENQTTLIR
jgi:hypothetical protein